MSISANGSKNIMQKARLLTGIGLLNVAPHHDPIWALGDKSKALIFHITL